ncbi:MAG: galactose-1-phosphate uridylyltransferase [Planctomycetota bacterium]|nr:MAG: galactose-1-phosphate uridylyltransferase [Planctomycetota bacterium]
MPELRRDPIIGRWVIIATERVKRPRDFRTEKQESRKGFCPFCKGFEDKTPPEILAYRTRDSRPNTPGWRVRVVPNKFPALRIEGGLGKKGDGIYDLMNGIGAHEVIIESPDHIVTNTELSNEHMVEVLWAYRDRMIDLKKDSRFSYGLLFKNVGMAAGASLEHAHTQLIVMPIVPRTVNAEMEGGRRFYNYRGRCIFCDMIIQEAADRKRVVLETEHYISFSPFAARFPFETWIVPKRHSSCFENIQKVEIEDLAETLKRTLKKIEVTLEMPPYNYVIHTSPFDQGELPYYHWHIEIIPRLTKVAGFEWGTGFYINPVTPEDAAEFLGQIEA